LTIESFLYFLKIRLGISFFSLFLLFFTISQNLISRFCDKTAKPRNFLLAKVSDNNKV